MKMLRDAAFAAPIVLLTLSTSAPARAADPTLAQCVSASNTAVALHSSHKLRQERTELLTCVALSCPAEVRTECESRMAPLAAALPSVVFEVKDGAGHELSDVKVTMDGEVVAERLDGTALVLDPGSHLFAFVAAGQPPAVATFILHEGEKNRHETVTVGPVAAPPVVAPVTPLVEPSRALAPLPPEPAPARAERGSAVRTFGLFTAGAGLVVGLGGGGAFGGLAYSSWSKVKDQCKNLNACTDTGDRNNAITFATVSTASFIAGGVLLAGGLTMFFVAPKDSAPAVGLQVLPRGVGVVGRF